MILGENNEKMSKSRGNVVNPDDIVNEFGTDTLRTYEMFMGAFDQAAPWSTQGVKGCRKFLERVWNLQDILSDSLEISSEHEKEVNAAIKKVSDDYEKMKFNTAIATLMSLVNSIYDAGKLSKGDLKILLILLNPVAPHITEEMWINNNFGGYIHEQKWPVCDESKLVETEIEVPIQINGKLRTVVKVSVDAGQEEILNIAKENLKEQLAGKEIVKVIFVPGKIFNIVVK